MSGQINKDKIEGCKLCKFRYLCYDTCQINKKGGKYFRAEPCSLFPELFEF